MKKILIIHHSGLLGGAGKSVLDIYKILNQSYHVVLYLPENLPDLYEYAKSIGITDVVAYNFKIGSVPYFSGGHEKINIRFIARYALSLLHRRYWINVYIKEKPDLVIVNSKILCWMTSIFKMFPVKMMCFVRETIPDPENSKIENHMRKHLEQFDSVAFLSEYDKVSEHLKTTHSVIIPDYIQEKDYSKKLSKKDACNLLRISSESFNVLYIGGVNQLKGFDTFLFSAIALKQENINFVVAGYGFEEENDKCLLCYRFINRKAFAFQRKMKQYINKNNCKVQFIGIQKDINTCYCACDVLVIPMNEPHQARPMFEIGAQRKTFIISDYEQIQEYCVSGKNCLTFPRRDAGSLAEKILLLKNDKELREKLGENNYKTLISAHLQIHATEAIEKEIDYLLRE